MKTVEIKNWKEVVDQFGLEMAKKTSKRLRIVFKLSPENIAIECSENSEAVALFDLMKIVGDKYIYEYAGTAN